MPATHASHTGTLVFSSAETVGARPRLKILFVAQRYHPYVGGVETQTRLVLHELAKTHDVEVAAIQFEESSHPQRLALLGDSLLISDYPSYTDEAIPVHALTPTWTDRLRMLPIAARAIPRLTRYKYFELRRMGYRWFRRVYVPKFLALLDGVDVVHSVAGGYLGWAAQEAAQIKGIPFVCTPYVHPGQHGGDEDSVAYYNRSDAVLALLETDRDLLVDLGVTPDRIHLYGVVPLLPDTDDPNGFRERYGFGDKPLVLFVGRMVEYKGVVALKDAAKQVWETDPDVQFVFIGPVSDENAAALKAVDRRIHVLGFVSKQEKADAYAACTVFCMPSRFEILPAVYLEAWSYGKPVIGGPAHGLRELIEGNGAGLVAEQTPDSVAHALITLLGDESRRNKLGIRGRDLVDRRYTVESLTGVLETVYKSVRAESVRVSQPA